MATPIKHYLSGDVCGMGEDKDGYFMEVENNQSENGCDKVYYKPQMFADFLYNNKVIDWPNLTNLFLWIEMDADETDIFENAYNFLKENNLYEFPTAAETKVLYEAFKQEQQYIIDNTFIKSDVFESIANVTKP